MAQIRTKPPTRTTANEKAVGENSTSAPRPIHRGKPVVRQEHKRRQQPSVSSSISCGRLCYLSPTSVFTPDPPTPPLLPSLLVLRFLPRLPRVVSTRFYRSARALLPPLASDSQPVQTTRVVCCCWALALSTFIPPSTCIMRVALLAVLLGATLAQAQTGLELTPMSDTEFQAATVSRTPQCPKPPDEARQCVYISFFLLVCISSSSACLCSSSPPCVHMLTATLFHHPTGSVQVHQFRAIQRRLLL